MISSSFIKIDIYNIDLPGNVYAIVIYLIKKITGIHDINFERV